MPELRILKPTDYITMPWRNGKGNTIELLKEALPDSDGFAWRLSMADVTSDGEFSNFGGYQRTLLLLEGNGITLDCNQSHQHRLTQRLQAAEFSGDDNTIASLHDGPIKDFNIMTHRDHCSAVVTTCNQPEDMPIIVDARVILIYVVEGELEVHASSVGTLTIPQQHLLVIHSPAREVLQCQGAAFIATQIVYLG